MQSLLLTALMDVDVTNQSAGSLENLLTISFEKTVIDNEVIGRVRRIIQGINNQEDAFSVDIIVETGHGKDFLMHDSTLDHLRDGWQAEISDWNRYDQWRKFPYPDIEKRAHARVRDILGSAGQILDPSVAKELEKYIAHTEGDN